MNWLIWIMTFISLGTPIGILMIDRILAWPARTLIIVWGLPSLVVFLIGALYSFFSNDPLWDVIFWGIISGILGTIALDIVRLLGVRLGAFPMDMPLMFGAITFGIAPKLQQNMIAQMVAYLAELPEQKRKMMMQKQLKALPKLGGKIRLNVVSAMQRGLMKLPENKRKLVIRTQMELLADLPSGNRQLIMKAMDEAPNFKPIYEQNRGVPKIPMALFSTFMNQAFPQTLKENDISLGMVKLRGYLWHFAIGITFSITYLMVFGSGSWLLALGWGVFIWLGMMIFMPPMMPMIRFPRWFPIVPLLAHLAFAIPIGYFALNYISNEAALIIL